MCDHFARARATRVSIVHRRPCPRLEGQGRAQVHELSLGHRRPVTHVGQILCVPSEVNHLNRRFPSPSFVDRARRDESALVGEGTRDACRSRAIEPTVELEVFGEMEYSTYPEPHAGARYGVEPRRARATIVHVGDVEHLDTVALGDGGGHASQRSVKRGRLHVMLVDGGLVSQFGQIIERGGMR